MNKKDSIKPSNLIIIGLFFLFALIILSTNTLGQSQESIDFQVVSTLLVDNLTTGVKNKYMSSSGAVLNGTNTIIVSGLYQGGYKGAHAVFGLDGSFKSVNYLSSPLCTSAEKSQLITYGGTTRYYTACQFGYYCGSTGDYLTSGTTLTNSLGCSSSSLLYTDVQCPSNDIADFTYYSGTNKTYSLTNCDRIYIFDGLNTGSYAATIKLNETFGFNTSYSFTYSAINRINSTNWYILGYNSDGGVKKYYLFLTDTNFVPIKNYTISLELLNGSTGITNLNYFTLNSIMDNGTALFMTGYRNSYATGDGNTNTTLWMYDYSSGIGNDSLFIPSGYTEVEDNLFSNYICLNTEELCSNATILGGYTGEPPLNDYNIYASCSQGNVIQCDNECVLFVESADSQLEQQSGYTQYITGYCEPSSLEPPEDTELCVVRDEYICTSTKTYDLCTDTDGDGWLTYEPNTCGANQICNDGSNTTPCVAPNLSAWSYTDYSWNFYIETNHTYLDTIKVNPLVNVKMFGDVFKSIFPGLYATTFIGGAFLEERTAPVSPIFAYEIKFSYNDNLEATTYTSLNCEYSEVEKAEKRTKTLLTNNSKFELNFTPSTNSLKAGIDLNATSGDNTTSFTVQFFDGLNNNTHMVISVDKTSKTIEAYDVDSNLIGTTSYSGYDDVSNIHVELDYDRETSSFSSILHLSFSPDASGDDFIDEYVYTQPVSAYSGSPILLRVSVGATDTGEIQLLKVNTRNDLVAYSESQENSYSYKCRYNTDGCSTIRMFSSASNQPAYQLYKDYYYCHTSLGLGGTGLPEDEPSDTEEIVSGAFCFGNNTGERLFWSFIICVLIFLLFVIVGAVSGMLGLSVLAGSLITLFGLIAFAVMGCVPAWIIVILILIGSGIGLLILRNTFIGQGA